MGAKTPASVFVEGSRASAQEALTTAAIDSFHQDPYGAHMDEAETEVLAEVNASPARRWLAIAILASLGCLTLYMAFISPPALYWQIFLIGLGIGALFLADKMRRSTENVIELTQEGLKIRQGELIAAMSDIKAVERGVFAFKPSNGFLVTTKTSGPPTWQTGLWWRLGRRIGVGGVTAASETKAMADILAARLVERDGRT